MHANPVAIAPDTTIERASAIMREGSIRHLPVVEGGRIVGVVTDRDLRLATSALAPRPCSLSTAVREVMSQPVQTTHPLDPIEAAARVMRELKIGCMPVLDGAVLVGIVTGVDILDALLRLTGVGRSSGRLEVSLTDEPGELAGLTRFLADKGINILSILSYPVGEHSGRTVLRVATMEIRALADELREAGFEVLWPPAKPC